MAVEEIVFLNQNLKLAGTLYLPETGAPYPAVVAVHPASEAQRTSLFFAHLTAQLPPAGIAVLLFDRRGSGASDGEFATADFEALAGDVLAAVAYLQSRPEIDGRRIGLHGTSQGAWIAPLAAARQPEIAALVAVSAAGVSPAEQMDYGVSFHLAQAGYGPEVIAQALALRGRVHAYFRGQAAREAVAAELGRHEHEPWFEDAYLYPSGELPSDVTRSKWHYEMDYEPLPVWQKVEQPTLFLFADVDEWVPVDQSLKNYTHATRHLSDVTLTRVSGTDHLMRTAEGEVSPAYLSVLLAWLTARLAVPRRA